LFDHYKADVIKILAVVAALLFLAVFYTVVYAIESLKP
jgi:phage shock protein PspC (stress-responsive transcriptional regulator)